MDDGKTMVLPSAQLFVIPTQFLSLKFQAVEVVVSYLDMLENNEFIMEKIQKNLVNKKYLARRLIGSKNLTISIFNSRNECMNEKFFRQYDNFMFYKPSEGEDLDAFISYVDDETSLVYLQLPGDLKSKFDEKMSAINLFFDNQSKQSNELEYFQKNINNLTTDICCARYSLDGLWYRVKFMRKWAIDTVSIYSK